MPKFCACGCGETVGIARQTQPELGHVKGQPFTFKGGHQRRLLPVKKYPAKRHPHKATGVMEVHRLRAERALGRPLPPGAEVHHLDGTKSVTSPLVICESVAYHKFLHIRMRVKAAGGDPNTQRVCRVCKGIKAIELFVKDSGYCGVRTICKDCFNIHRRRRGRSVAEAA